MFIQFVFIVFIIATLIQLYYWLFIFSKLAHYKNENTLPDQDIPVSVIICARNEAENLQNNLHRILNQNYRSFEVLVVDDNSDDTSPDILLKYLIDYSNLRVLTVDDKPEGSGKKFALSKGIEAARYEVLLLTDADCVPASENWIREMVRPIQGPVEMAFGYAPYFKAKGFLDKFIRYETHLTAIQYFSFALLGHPYMGVGRNLIYKKSLYKKAGGFEKHKTLLSGDDDLFVNAVATSNNVGIVLEPESFVYSAAKKSWKAFYQQKARHLTTGKHYKNKHKFLLGLYSLSHFLHYTGGFVLLYCDFSTVFAVGLFYSMRISVILLLSRAVLSKLQDSTLLKWYPALDAFLVLYYVLFSPTLLKGNTNRWK